MTVVLTRAQDLASALAQVASNRAEVLLVQGSESIRPHFGKIATFAIERKLPTISGAPPFVNSGGLLYYGPELPAMVDRVASCADRILRGAKAADLPVEQPSKYELLLNSKTAKAMGLTLPPAFMAQVDRTIE